MNISDFKFSPGASLKDFQTKVIIDNADKELTDLRKKLGDIQDKMYAHGKYAVLVCLQGMDTAGKDSLIREVFKDFNARGVIVHRDRKSTRLNSSHVKISYAVFCL